MRPVADSVMPPLVGFVTVTGNRPGARADAFLHKPKSMMEIANVAVNLLEQR